MAFASLDRIQPAGWVLLASSACGTLGIIAWAVILRAIRGRRAEPGVRRAGRLMAAAFPAAWAAATAGALVSLVVAGGDVPNADSAGRLPGQWAVWSKGHGLREVSRPAFLAAWVFGYGWVAVSGVTWTFGVWLRSRWARDPAPAAAPDRRGV